MKLLSLRRRRRRQLFVARQKNVIISRMSWLVFLAAVWTQNIVAVREKPTSE